jgi:predicted acylesterase/phospholipase RssA
MGCTISRPKAVLALVLLALSLGCIGPSKGPRVNRARGERTTDELKASADWLDVEAQEAGRSTIKTEDLLAFAKRSRDEAKPAKPYPRKTILVMSGGGAYGAYPAGVLVGWTASGTRPEFDVVTGISIGALMAAFAFLGPSEDYELQRCATTLHTSDIYRRKCLVTSMLSESLADTAPLEKLIDELTTEDRLQRIAAEHRKGRRLYVGTTDLDARRAIVWDMGAIAARGTPESRELFCKVMLASATIPGFFPPVRIPITVDGRRYVERHIDGGTTSSMFFAPPWVPPAERDHLPRGWLHGSDVYVLVAGKMYPDPRPVKPRAVRIAATAASTVIYDQTRSDLHKLFLLSAMTGMNYNVSLIPPDLPVPATSTTFEPAEMTRMFNAGFEWAVGGPKWRITPPGYEPGEGAKYRAGPALTDTAGRHDWGLQGPPCNPISLMGVVVPEK